MTAPRTTTLASPSPAATRAGGALLRPGASDLPRRPRGGRAAGGEGAATRPRRAPRRDRGGDDLRHRPQGFRARGSSAHARSPRSLRTRDDRPIVAAGSRGPLASAGSAPKPRPGGPGSAHLREGDAVVVANSASCGTCPACRGGRENLCPDLAYLNGAYADYLLVPARFVERSTYLRPANLAPELAALAEPLACVEHGLVRLGLAGLRRREQSSGRAKILVQGAGPLGLLFVAVLCELGHRVTAADPHALRLEVALRLGAEATHPHRAVVERRALVDRPRVRDRHRRHRHGRPAGRPLSPRPCPAARRSSSAVAPRPTASSSRPFPSTTTSSRCWGATTIRRAASGRRSTDSPRRAPTIAFSCLTTIRWTRSKRPCAP